METPEKASAMRSVQANQDAMRRIKKALGKPAYDRDGVLLYQGDCVELLDRLPEKLISLTVTSPPYNIGKEYERPKAIDDYLDWCSKWINGIHRAVDDRGAFWLNLGYLKIPERARAVPIPYLLWDRVPFYLMQEIVWHYGAGVAARQAFSPRNEKFLWYVSDPDDYYFDLDAVRDPNVKYPNQFKNGRRKVNPLGKNPTDVWSIPKVTSGKRRSSKERTGHPAQFPVAVIERIVKACSPPGALVLDPFMGSGTVAAVAGRLGRAVVGFELVPEYMDIAIERIEGLRLSTSELEPRLVA